MSVANMPSSNPSFRWYSKAGMDQAATLRAMVSQIVSLNIQKMQLVWGEYSAVPSRFVGILQGSVDWTSRS